MSESIFLNIIHRYFIKSVALQKSFKYRNFDRFVKIRIAEKKVPGINKSANCTFTRNKGFFKVIWAFFMRIFTRKEEKLSELGKLLKYSEGSHE